MARSLQLLGDVTGVILGTVLVFFEPVVQWVSSVAMVLGLLTCLIFELSPASPKFPLLAFFGASVGVGAIPILYTALLVKFIER